MIKKQKNKLLKHVLRQLSFLIIVPITVILTSLAFIFVPDSEDPEENFKQDW